MQPTASASRATLDDLASQLLSPMIELEAMSVAIEDGGGRLIGWCGLEPRIGGDTWNRIHVHGSVHPDLRGRGHGRTLLRWAEARSPSILVAGTPRPDLPDVLTVHANGARPRSCQAPGALRVQPRALVQRHVPDALRAARPGAAARRLSVRRLDARAGSTAFHAADLDAFRDHWGSAPWSAEAWRHEYADDEGFRPDLTVGVERDGEVVGYVMVAAYGGVEDDEGRRVAWLARLGVRRGHRGLGIGAAAITRALGLARDAGFATAGLDVDTENVSGALRLYERLGFYPVKRLALRAKTIREATTA